MRYLVYTGCDPESGHVRYVGKTVRGVERRTIEHLWRARNGGRTHPYCWMRALLKAGVTPVFEVLEEYSSFKEMNAGEAFWIENLKFLGCDLTNHGTGGEGPVGVRRSAEFRAKISVASKGRKYPARALAMQGNEYATRRPIVDQNGNHYVSTVSACRILGLQQGCVIRVLKGRARSHKGYVFTYTDNNLTKTEN